MIGSSVVTPPPPCRGRGSSYPMSNLLAVLVWFRQMLMKLRWIWSTFGKRCKRRQITFKLSLRHGSFVFKDCAHGSGPRAAAVAALQERLNQGLSRPIYIPVRHKSTQIWSFSDLRSEPRGVIISKSDQEEHMGDKLSKRVNSECDVHYLLSKIKLGGATGSVRCQWKKVTCQQPHNTSVMDIAPNNTNRAPPNQPVIHIFICSV